MKLEDRRAQIGLLFAGAALLVLGQVRWGVGLLAWITPIPFLGMEGAVQLNHAVIPLIEARMNDATNSMSDAMATALYTNYTNNQQFIGLDGAIDDGTNLTSYGNINRSESR